MREILFRAWDKTENKYKKFDGMHDTMLISRDGKVEYYNLQNGSGGDEYILEQFTGLLDKNGKKIFEGDIVRIEDFANYAVKWREDIACWTLNGYVIGNTWGSSMLEVIGNIHDNPDWMKEKKNDCYK